MAKLKKCKIESVSPETIARRYPWTVLVPNSAAHVDWKKKHEVIARDANIALKESWDYKSGRSYKEAHKDQLRRDILSRYTKEYRGFVHFHAEWLKWVEPRVLTIFEHGGDWTVRRLSELLGGDGCDDWKRQYPLVRAVIVEYVARGVLVCSGQVKPAGKGRPSCTYRWVAQQPLHT